MMHKLYLDGEIFMKTYELVVPCHFGMEAVTKREIYDLGYEITRVEDGRITFEGDAEAICRANVFLRTAERVLICVGRFKAYTFDELFENVKVKPAFQSQKYHRLLIEGLAAGAEVDVVANPPVFRRETHP